MATSFLFHLTSIKYVLLEDNELNTILFLTEFLVMTQILILMELKYQLILYLQLIHLDYYNIRLIQIDPNLIENFEAWKLKINVSSNAITLKIGYKSCFINIQVIKKLILVNLTINYQCGKSKLLFFK